MDKHSELVRRKRRVTENNAQLSIDLNVPNILPGEGKMVNSTDQPKRVRHALPNFYIDLCFPVEDMARLKNRYEVMDSSSANDHKSSAKDEDFERLGFVNGIRTLMFTKSNKAKCPGKSSRAMGRSLFQKGFTNENQCASRDINGAEKKNHDEDDADRLESKQKLREFVEQAKAKAQTRQEGKKVESRVTVLKKKKKAKKEKMLPLVQVLEASKGEAVSC